MSRDEVLASLDYPKLSSLCPREGHTFSLEARETTATLSAADVVVFAPSVSIFREPSDEIGERKKRML